MPNKILKAMSLVIFGFAGTLGAQTIESTCDEQCSSLKNQPTIIFQDCTRQCEEKKSELQALDRQTQEMEEQNQLLEAQLEEERSMREEMEEQKAAEEVEKPDAQY